MTIRRVVYPLFLVLLAFALVLPSQVHAGSPVTFRSLCDASVNNSQVTTLNCTVTGVLSGDVIVVAVYGIGAFNGFTTTDSQSNTYIQKVSSVTGISSGASTYIFVASTTTTSSDTVTVATGGPTRIYAFSASDYSGVASFGKTGSTQQDSIGSPSSSTNTLTGTLGSSLIIDEVAVSYNTGSSLSLTTSSGQTVRDSALGGFSNCWNLVGSASGCRTTDSVAPTNTWSFSASGIVCPCSSSQVDLELQAGSGSTSTTTVSQCYGNCGNPPITLVNTNSTHSINFNQSITIFYEFQSNLNGVINNATTSIAKSYQVGTIHIAIYVIASCPVGSTPFTSACPGSKVAESTTSPPTKTVGVSTRFSTNPGASAGPVTTGQWVGIAISFSYSGLDLNDTNITGPTLFQTNGITPSTIIASSSTSCTNCKLGLWAWITGNVVVGPSPPSLPTGNCGNGIGDFLSCLTLSFCTGTPNSGCQLAGGFFWAMVYSAFGIVFVVAITKKAGADVSIIPMPVFFFIPFSVFFTFIALGALPAWVAFVFLVIVAFMAATLITTRGRSITA